MRMLGGRYLDNLVGNILAYMLMYTIIIEILVIQMDILNVK